MGFTRSPSFKFAVKIAVECVVYSIADNTESLLDKSAQ